MASNGTSIELHKRGTDPVQPRGWSLTDDPTQPGKWRCPERTLGTDGYLVMFASGRNGADVGSYTRTSALPAKAGFSDCLPWNRPWRPPSSLPPFLPRGSGASNGIFSWATVHDLIAGEPVMVLVPDSAGEVEGFGGKTLSSGLLILTDRASSLSGRHAPALVRVPFVMEAPESLRPLKLQMRYVGGVVASSSGEALVSLNAPGGTRARERTVIAAVITPSTEGCPVPTISSL